MAADEKSDVVVIPGGGGGTSPDDATVTVRVKVAPGTQVNHDGVVYGPGEAVELPEVEATRLLAAGIVLEPQ